MTKATFTHTPYTPRPRRLHMGRVLLLLTLLACLVFGGMMWLLRSRGQRQASAIAENMGGPGWGRMHESYEPEPVIAKAPPSPPVDTTAAELAALRAEWRAKFLAQEQAIEELRRRGQAQPTPPQQAQKAQQAKAPSSMLYVAHEVSAAPPTPKAHEYTLAPGATKLPCVLETAINSDVEGYLTARVTTNVYDTATGHHLLVPQGSTILGHDQSSTLLYGNERLPTVSLTLALPDGRSVELGQAPITDQQGIAGLGGSVDNHFWRLAGAVLIGGALRGGQQALQLQAGQAGPLGQVAGGVGQTSGQATQQRLGRALDTRPTITVAAGQLCMVLLLKQLTLPAMWQ